MKLITLIGADASGKDTQIALMKSRLESQGKSVQVITIWDSLAEFSAIEDKKVLKQTVETFLLKFEAEARSFFLLSCLKNSENKIDLNKDYVLLNGFYHKYWASEAAYGVPSDLWAKNTDQFRSSYKLIYLNTPLEICLQRKQHWSNYEQGLGKYKGAKIESKEKFQLRLHEELDRIVKTLPNVLMINGNRTEETVLQEILSLI